MKHNFLNKSILFFFILLLCYFSAIPEEAKISAKERETPFPVSENPSQIILTITENPTNSISIQWSTSPSIQDGTVEWREKNKATTTTQTPAQSTLISDPAIENNPDILRWSVTLTGLKPDTTYEYRVGSPAQNHWSPWYEFKTAPNSTQPFSFIYLGDAQNGFEQWSELLQKSIETCPDCAFIMMAGDLVNRGNDRDDWDAFFHYAGDVFARYPLVPTLGNHEYQRTFNPSLYINLFTLPTNGPNDVPPEYCYYFTYSNATFIILNANHNPETQKNWLDSTLTNSNSTWKFLLFHQPIYSSAPRRDNKHIREAWLPIIDQHHVDWVLQGHDHSYWRSYPLKNNQKVDSPLEGTYYVIAYSGSKSYNQQEKTDIIEVALKNTPTFQIITIETTPVHKLTYKAYDKNGNLKDEVIIDKSQKLSKSTTPKFAKKLIFIPIPEPIHSF